jgi:plastocyanin
VRIAAFAAVLGLIVCTTSLAGERAKSKTHTVTIEGMRFQPDSLTIARGDTVVWVNKDVMPHTATSEGGSFDSQIIQSEKSWKFTARKKGEFDYTCTFHPTMKAMLHVK